MTVVVDASAVGSEVLFQASVRHRLSACDASYPLFAERKGLPLLNYDADLARAAKAAGVVMLAP